MADTTRFFSPALSAPLVTNKPKTWVNVGGNGDCGFRSVAAAIIDNVLCNPKSNKELLVRLLCEHDNYFPFARTNPILLTPHERLKRIVEAPGGLARFLPELAYTLRQLAVDTLCKNPERYRGAFVSENENTSPEDMRKATTWIDETAIAALSDTLQLPVTVNVVAHDKELPMKLHYGPENAACDEVVIRLNSGHYIPAVKQVERFNSAVYNVVTPPKPEVLSKPADPELSELLERIRKDDERLVNEFEETKGLITELVNSGQLNKEQLLLAYVKGMANSDYLTGRVKQVGLEHGNATFFAQAIARVSKHNGVVPPVEVGSFDDLVTKELVHALARAISIGQMDMDVVLSTTESLSL